MQSCVWIACVGLLSCGGARATVRPARGSASSASPAPPPPRAPDALLRGVPADAQIVVHVDLRANRALGLLPIWQPMLTLNSPETRRAVDAACGEGEATEQVDSYTMHATNDGHAVVILRGTAAEPGREACAQALAGLAAGGVERFERVVHADGAVVMGPTQRVDATVAAMAGQGPSADAVSALHAGSDAWIGAPITVRITGRPGEFLSPLGSVASVLVGAMGGAAGMRSANALRSFDCSVVGGAGDGTHVTTSLLFADARSAASVRDALAELRSVAIRNAEESRRVRAAVGESGAPRDANDGSAVTLALLRGASLALDGTRVVARTDLTSSGLATVREAVQAMVAHTTRQMAVMEAVQALDVLAHGVASLVQSSSSPPGSRRARRRPTWNAPRTPATVPRGEPVVDPAGTWAHATWQALHFVIAEPHWYSYEIEMTNARSFVVRAYGDTDGDGVLTTLERRGTVSPQGAVDLDPELHVTNSGE